MTQTVRSDGRRWATAGMWALVAAFAITFAVLALRRHEALATNGMDLGNVDQALWNTAHGRLLEFTNMFPVTNRLALHVEPILLLLVPFYWLGLGGPRFLLVVQALVVALGAWPLYWIARDELPGRHPWLYLVFPLAYLLAPALQAAVLYDFHAVTLAPTFLLLAFHALEDERPWRYALFAALAVACKEDMALVVAMLGMFALLTGRRWRWAVPTVFLSLTWFCLALFVIQPAFSPTGGNVQADRYAWLGATPAAVVTTLTGQPGMVWRHLWQAADLTGYLAGLGWPTGFLAVLAPLSWLPASPSLVINLLSDNPFSWRLEEFHYAAPIVPFLFVSAIRGTRFLGVMAGRMRPRWTRVAVAVACVWLLVAAGGYSWARGFAPGSQAVRTWPVTDHARRAQSVFDQVPPQARLFAQSNLNPHVSQRRALYVDANLLVDPRGEALADTMLFDVSTLTNEGGFHDKVLRPLLEGGRWRALAADDGLLLLAAGSDGRPATLPDDFFSFARVAESAPAYTLEADFGDAIRLTGFDLAFNRAEEVQPVAYLTALRPLDQDYRVALFLLDQWGGVIGATTERQPALVWWPTSHWQPGETVRVMFNTLPWYSGDMDTYRLALGVFSGEDVWQPAARMRPQVAKDTRYAVALPGDGTLLELARFHKRWGMPRGGPRERSFRAPAIQNPIEASFGGQVRLLGYDLERPACMAPAGSGDTGECALVVTLYWQAQTKVAEDYTVFIHLTGQDGRILAQHDGQPAGGAYATGRWSAGEVVGDWVSVGLPVDSPAGEYDLVVGVYRPETGERLPRLDAEGRPVDDKIVFPGAIKWPVGGR